MKNQEGIDAIFSFPAGTIAKLRSGNINVEKLKAAILEKLIYDTWGFCRRLGVKEVYVGQVYIDLISTAISKGIQASIESPREYTVGDKEIIRVRRLQL